MNIRRELKDMLDKECGMNATWEIEQRGRHQAILLYRTNKRRMVTVSRSPSDRKALLNIRADIRHALRDLTLIQV